MWTALKTSTEACIFQSLGDMEQKLFFDIGNYPCIKFSMEGCLSEAEPSWVCSFTPHSYRVKFQQLIMKSRESLELLFGGTWQVHISSSLLNCLVMLFSPWTETLLTASLYNSFRPSLVYSKYMLTSSSFHFIDDYAVCHKDWFHLTDNFF